MSKNKLTKEDVENALINARVTAKLLKDNNNPSSREVYFEAEGRAAAFEAVLNALNGEPVFMHIYSRKENYLKPL